MQKKKKKDIRDDSQALDSRCYVRGKKSLLKWGGRGLGRKVWYSYLYTSGDVKEAVKYTNQESSAESKDGDKNLGNLSHS